MHVPIVLALCAALLGATTALAGDTATVPLPKEKKAKPAPVSGAQTCTLGGGTFTGTRVPGTDVCVKAGGFVRWQATGTR
ncbi:porin [Nostoc sp. NIES-2111]